MDRKLIRPRLDQHVARASARPQSRRRRAPEAMGLEASFYARHAAGSAVRVTLEDGQVIHGVVEWTDRDAMALRRKDLPPIVVMKQVVVHVVPDGSGRRG